MKIISWNVNGIRAIAQKNFYESIGQLNPDVLCLQEIKAGEDIVGEIAGRLTGYQYHANPAAKKGYSGTALFTKKTPLVVTTGPGSPPFNDEGRILCADYGDFFLVNVYVPNSGQGLKRLDYRQEWDAAFLGYLKDLHSRKPVILCGDLNVAHRPIDLKNDKSNYNKTAGYTQIEIDGMDRLQQAGFNDFYRVRHPETVAYTYWSYRFKARERNVGWRIDYFLVTPEVAAWVEDVQIYPEIMGSDHCPVGLTLQLA